MSLCERPLQYAANTRLSIFRAFCRRLLFELGTLLLPESRDTIIFAAKCDLLTSLTNAGGRIAKGSRASGSLVVSITGIAVRFRETGKEGGLCRNLGTGSLDLLGTAAACTLGI